MGGRGGWRGLGTLVPTAAARRAGARPMCGEGGGGEPLLGGAPRAALALPACLGPVRFRASFPCARASAWNRVALTWARGRGCAAPPQATTSAPPARQLWRPRSRRTRRSRRSTSSVRKRALGWPRGMEGLGDAWAHGRGPPRRRAPNVRGGRGRRAFARWRASGCARPASSVGPRAFSCELPLRACFGLESCGADLGSGSRVCCSAAGNRIGVAGATALAAALQKNTTVTAVNLNSARACSGGRGGWRGWGRFCPRPRPAAQARPMCGEGERESLCTAARLGQRSPCQQRRAPRVLVRASLARVLRLGIVWR